MRAVIRFQDSHGGWYRTTGYPTLQEAVGNIRPCIQEDIRRVQREYPALPVDCAVISCKDDDGQRFWAVSYLDDGHNVRLSDLLSGHFSETAWNPVWDGGNSVEERW